MSDKGGFRPLYTVGEETNDMRAASFMSMLPRVSRARRTNKYIAIPMKEVIATKAITALGIIGTALSVKSIWDNYHSGYGFWEATGRSSIDIIVFGGSVVAGGEVLKNFIWGKKD